MSEPDRQDSGNRKNQRVVVALLGLFVGMVGLSFASVPLYDLFCRVTGIAGTTQVSEAAPGVVGEETVTIRFNSDVNQRLPWRFAPEQRSMEVRIGEPNLVHYHAKNLSSRPTIGTAVYNVSPFQAGSYFHKVQCFCFEEQKLEPGEEMAMGVSFYVDPAILEDPRFRDMHTITLSYTFFRDLDDWDAEQEEQQLSDETAPAGSGYRQEQRAAR